MDDDPANAPVPRRILPLAAVGVLLLLVTVPRVFGANFILTPNLTYSTVTASNRPAIALQLDLYQPTNALPATPLVIWIHGGGWKGGSRHIVSPTVTALCARGYAVASIDYRLSQLAKWPAQIQDCKAAVRWLRANAAVFNLDPLRFAAWGVSAGGHLAAMLGTSGDVSNVTVGAVTVSLVSPDTTHADMSDRVQAVVDWFGPTDLLLMDNFPSQILHDALSSPESQLIGALLQTQPQRAATANPVVYVSPDDPPFLVMHGTSDTQVPFNQSELLHIALLDAGVPVTFFPVVGGTHGGPEWDATDAAGTVYTFLDATFGNVVPGPTPSACDFTVTLAPGTAPATLTAEPPVQPDGTVVTNAWAFGDNTGVAVDTATHTYNVPGQYVVTLAMRDALFNASSCAQRINVDPVSATTNAMAFGRVVSPTETTPLTEPATIVVQARLANTRTKLKVEFYANEQFLGVDTVFPYSVTWPNVGAGAYALTTRIIDTNGVAYVSTPVNIVVGNATSQIMRSGPRTRPTRRVGFARNKMVAQTSCRGTGRLSSWCRGVS